LFFRVGLVEIFAGEAVTRQLNQRSFERREIDWKFPQWGFA
jgi:hypothetical protein